MDQISQHESTAVSKTGLHGTAKRQRRGARETTWCQTKKPDFCHLGKRTDAVGTSSLTFTFTVGEINISFKNVPCIGVASNPDGIGKLCLKRWQSTQPAGKDEVKKAP